MLNLQLASLVIPMMGGKPPAESSGAMSTHKARQLEAVGVLQNPADDNGFGVQLILF